MRCSNGLLETEHAPIVWPSWRLPDLLACRERLRLTPDNQVVGYRRLYADSMAPDTGPARTGPTFSSCVARPCDVPLQGGLLASFDEWAGRCRAAGLRLQGDGGRRLGLRSGIPGGHSVRGEGGPELRVSPEHRRRRRPGNRKRRPEDDGEISPRRI